MKCAAFGDDGAMGGGERLGAQIRALPSEPAVESPTREVFDGESVVISAKFEKFDSLTQAFELHGKLLPPRRLQAGDDGSGEGRLIRRFPHRRLCHRSRYGITLKWVIHNYGWDQYDK